MEPRRPARTWCEAAIVGKAAPGSASCSSSRARRAAGAARAPGRGGCPCTGGGGDLLPRRAAGAHRASRPDRLGPRPRPAPLGGTGDNRLRAIALHGAAEILTSPACAGAPRRARPAEGSLPRHRFRSRTDWERPEEFLEGARLGRPARARIDPPQTPASPWRSRRQSRPVRRAWCSSRLSCESPCLDAEVRAGVVCAGDWSAVVRIGLSVFRRPVLRVRSVRA
jgi:hypothetical protein